MTATSAAAAAYIVAALLFILSLAGLSRHETAKTGNAYGMAGMVIALAATIGLAVDHGISGTGAVLLVALKRPEVPLLDRRIVTPQAAIVAPVAGDPARPSGAWDQ